MHDDHLWDPRTPLKPWAASIRDGQMVLEQLQQLESMAATANAIGALEERGRKLALLLAVVHLKRGGA